MGERIPVPRKRCENCANGTMYDKVLSPTVRHTYQDIFVCSVHGYNCDYRVTCEHWAKKQDAR